MAKLSEKQITEVKELLGDYQKICDLLSTAGKSKYSIYIVADDDSEDTEEVQVRKTAAIELLKAEKLWAAAELQNLGITV